MLATQWWAILPCFSGLKPFELLSIYPGLHDLPTLSCWSLLLQWRKLWVFGHYWSPPLLRKHVRVLCIGLCRKLCSLLPIRSRTRSRLRLHSRWSQYFFIHKCRLLPFQHQRAVSVRYGPTVWPLRRLLFLRTGRLLCRW